MGIGAGTVPEFVSFCNAKNVDLIIEILRQLQ